MVVNKLIYEKEIIMSFPETEKLQDIEMRAVIAVFPSTGGWR